MHIFFIFLNIAFRENGSLGLHSFSDHLDNERKCSDYVITCEGLQVYASEPSNVNISHLFFLNLVLIMYCVVYSVISFFVREQKKMFHAFNQKSKYGGRDLMLFPWSPVQSENLLPFF